MSQIRPTKKRKVVEQTGGTGKLRQTPSHPAAKSQKPSARGKGGVDKAGPPSAEKVVKKVTKTKETTLNPSTAVRKPITIVAGSYERILYGLQVEPNETGANDVGEPSSQVKLKPVFIFPAHISCVKAVAASPQGGKWLATGGTDESVKVWDLGRKKELGSLQQHQGSVTFLNFPTRTHLLSASEDGTICLYHTRDWAVLATLNGHKGRVNAVAVHPSSKVCLSVGKDRTLRMWDLMRGKGSASIKLGKEGEGVRWDPSGSYFAVFSENSIDIYSTKMALLRTINHPARVHDIRFCRIGLECEVLMVAAEDKQVTAYTLDRLADGTDPVHGPDNGINILFYLRGHTNRVKALDVLSFQDTTYVATVSSDGRIHLYEPSTGSIKTSRIGDPSHIEPLAVYDTKGSRLTCVTMVEGGSEVANSALRQKRERSQSSDEADDG